MEKRYRQLDAAQVFRGDGMQGKMVWSGGEEETRDGQRRRRECVGENGRLGHRELLQMLGTAGGKEKWNTQKDNSSARGTVGWSVVTKRYE